MKVHYVAAVLSYVAAGGPASAQTVRWALTATNPLTGDPVPNVVGPPDDQFAGGRLLMRDFGAVMVYRGLAPFLGLSPALVGKANFIAWEGNGESPGASGGWESVRFVFNDGTHVVTVNYNEVAGTADNPAFLATGSVTGAVYGSYYGVTAPLESVYSYIIFQVPSAIDLGLLKVEMDSGVLVGLPGEGTPDPDAFGVILPCEADLNGDGLVDFSDYLEFLNLYDAGDPTVDFNGDGLVDFSDYLEFLNLYDAGC